MDKQIKSGDYFLDEKSKKAKIQKEREEKQMVAAKEREERRNKDFIPPEEKDTVKTKVSTKPDINIAELKSKIAKARKGAKRLQS